MRMKVLALLIFSIVVLVGCATMSADQIKALPDDQLGRLDRDALRTELLRRHTEWPEGVRKAIAEGRLIVGMSALQVDAAWGVPPFGGINKTVGSWGTHEQWIYNNYYPTRYAYIENDILTSYQES